MLLRLRQLCSHVLLIQQTLVDLLEREDFEKLWTICSLDLSDETQELLQYLHHSMSRDTNGERTDSTDDKKITETETVPIGRLAFDSLADDLGGVHGLTYNFSRYLNGLRNSEVFDEITRRTRCAACKQPPSEAMVTSCHHVYCHDCLNELAASAHRKLREQVQCIECGIVFHDARPCERELEEFSAGGNPSTGSSEDSSSSTGSSKKKKKKPELENWLYMKGEVLPSSKTVALKAQIMTWIAEDPDVKIIVYSQFIAMINLLGRICNTEDWKAEKYTGGMSQECRQKALASFGDPKKEVRVLLASLKCGGIGLNLTMASRVICLDPWV